MNTTSLEFGASRRVLELLLSTDLADVAASALADGCDSPSLRLLAALPRDNAYEADGLLARALAELGVPWPSPRDAVMTLATKIAGDILSGAMTPGEGASGISDLASLIASDQDLPQLDTFVYAASEYAERPKDRGVFDQGVIAAASELHERPGPLAIS